MKYLYLLALTILIAPAKLLAQRNFKPGYVVSLKGDTTKGFVDYRQWDNNPKAVNFKAGENDAVIRLSVANATAFGIYGVEEYNRYIGQVSVNETDNQRLINSKDTASKADSVFLKRIAKGKYISLFKYTDYLKDRFFVSEGNSGPVELKYYRYLDNHNLKIIRDDAYHQQMQRLVSHYRNGDLKLIQKVQAADYNASDLEKVVNTINGLDEVNKNNKSNGSAVEYFAGVAANANHVVYRVHQGKSNTSVMPMLNAGINVFFNKAVRKTFLKIELNFTGSKVDISSQPSVNGGQADVQRLTFNQFVAGISPQILYNLYNTDNAKFFLGAGLAYNFSKYSEERQFIGQRELSKPVLRGTYMSMVFKAGVTLKKTEIYAGYNRPIGDFVQSSIIRSSYQLGVNYSFK